MIINVRKLLASRPPEGTGLHQWIFRAACTLIKRHSEDYTRSFLVAATKECGRDTRREIDDAIRNAQGSHKRSGTHHQHVPAHARWPARDDGLVKRIITSGVGQAALMAFSPYKQDQGVEMNVPNILRHLFPDGPLLCLGWSQNCFHTMLLSEWCDLAIGGSPLQFIVPSPMSKPRGLTKEGKLSARSNDNTGDRRFLVVEFDFKPDKNPRDAELLAYGNQFGLTTTLDLCASLLAELARVAPLVLVVWSGGKSLQGWFPVAGISELAVEQFFRHACSLGADTATWTKSQLVRLPCGQRDNGNIQSVIYFNPKLPVL